MEKIAFMDTNVQRVWEGNVQGGRSVSSFTGVSETMFSK